MTRRRREEPKAEQLDLVAWIDRHRPASLQWLRTQLPDSVEVEEWLVERGTQPRWWVKSRGRRVAVVWLPWRGKDWCVTYEWPLVGLDPAWCVTEADLWAALQAAW